MALKGTQHPQGAATINRSLGSEMNLLFGYPSGNRQSHGSSSCRLLESMMMMMTRALARALCPCAMLQSKQPLASTSPGVLPRKGSMDQFVKVLSKPPAIPEKIAPVRDVDAEVEVVAQLVIDGFVHKPQKSIGQPVNDCNILLLDFLSAEPAAWLATVEVAGLAMGERI